MEKPAGNKVSYAAGCSDIPVKLVTLRLVHTKHRVIRIAIFINSVMHGGCVHSMHQCMAVTFIRARGMAVRKMNGTPLQHHAVMHGVCGREYASGDPSGHWTDGA